MILAAQTTGYLMLLALKLKTLLKTMKKIQLITKGIVKNSPQKAALKMLSPLKKSSYKYRTGKVPDGMMARWPDGPMARWHDGDLPGVDSDKDTVLKDPVPEEMLLQLIVQCVPSERWGCSCRYAHTGN